MSSPTKRLLLWSLVAAALAGGALWWWVTRPPSLEAALERIHEGMTQEEVEQVLGGPPNHPGDWETVDDKGEAAFWDARGGMVGVNFDRNGRVTPSGVRFLADPPS